MNDKILAVIPARYDSKRLPGKPLADIAGKSLIQRVYEQAQKAKKIDKIIVATDDQRIYDHCVNAKINCLMTSSTHESGSDRVNEVVELERKKGVNYKLIINIQGDMPFLSPIVVDQTITAILNSSSSPDIGTIATPINTVEEFKADSAVKVVCDVNSLALYFSRSPIPFSRDASSQSKQTFGFKHVGLYIYTPQALERFTKLPPSRLETVEKLEQLRALEDGLKIEVIIIERDLLKPAIEVDTERDLALAREAAVTLN